MRLRRFVGGIIWWSVSSGEAIPMEGDAETAAIDNLIDVIPKF